MSRSEWKNDGVKEGRKEKEGEEEKEGRGKGKRERGKERKVEGVKDEGKTIRMEIKLVRLVELCEIMLLLEEMSCVHLQCLTP